MDNNFQTSFIPKKPLAEDQAPRQRHTSLFTFLGVVVFFVAILLAGGMYFYKTTLAKQIVSMNTDLELARNAFEPSLITELQILDRRINSANELLKNHIVVSPIFAALQESTLKSVQFTKFSYIFPQDQNGAVKVQMSGKARDYSSIALQSDELAKNRNIKDPIFANLALDERTGIVSFELAFTVDSDLVRYTSHLSERVTAPATLPTTTTPLPTTTTVPVEVTNQVTAPAGQ